MITKTVHDYFNDIAAIPHGSGNESSLADYIMRFASDNGLESCRDAQNNVFITRKSDKSSEYMLLQAHLDMVCEKNGDVQHDFENEGLGLYTENGWLKARGTTLGADDAAGVAIMLCILSDDDPMLPNIECLFTTNEETGMLGASSFDYSLINSRRLINLDSEEEGIALASCAGGVRTVLSMEYDRLPAVKAVKPYKITVTGLAGGHSGADIHLGRANANMIMGRILNKLWQTEPFSIFSVNGGLKANAIPRECSVIVNAPDLSIIDSFKKELHSEMTDADKKLRVYIDKAKVSETETMLSLKDSHKVISLLMASPYGVLSRCPSKPELVESSSNLGVIETVGGRINFVFENRSSVESRLDYIVEKLDCLSYALGMTAEHLHRYPGWSFDPNSELQKVYLKTYNELFGDFNKPVVSAIHAGLECGLIKERIPDMDIISIGPEIQDIHTPNERMNIASFERTYELVKNMLKTYKK